MKLTATTLAAAIGLSTATPSIRGNSPIGQKLLSQARRLADNGAYYYQNNDDAAVDLSWVGDYAIKFQGCYTTPQWNENAAAGDANGMKLSNLNLVTFRLCPADTCVTNSRYGCKEGHGDYVVDMDTYLQAYLDLQDYECEYARNQQCGCYANDYGGFDSFEKCEYDCFTSNKMSYCLSNNVYAEAYGKNGDSSSLKDLAQCQYAANDSSGGDEVDYYTGAYCSSDGSKIVMGLFHDNTCSELADVYGGGDKYKKLTGNTLPHTDTSMVDNGCMSCAYVSNNNNNNDDANAQNDKVVKEACEDLYELSGKCDGNNDNACQYIEGISVVYTAATPSSAYGVFIGLFGCSFVLLSTYGWYLKSKLDRAKIQLDDDLMTK